MAGITTTLTIKDLVAAMLANPHFLGNKLRAFCLALNVPGDQQIVPAESFHFEISDNTLVVRTTLPQLHNAANFYLILGSSIICQVIRQLLEKQLGTQLPEDFITLVADKAGEKDVLFTFKVNTPEGMLTPVPSEETLQTLQQRFVNEFNTKLDEQGTLALKARKMIAAGVIETLRQQGVTVSHSMQDAVASLSQRFVGSQSATTAPVSGAKTVGRLQVPAGLAAVISAGHQQSKPQETKPSVGRVHVPAGLETALRSGPVAEAQKPSIIKAAAVAETPREEVVRAETIVARDTTREALERMRPFLARWNIAAETPAFYAAYEQAMQDTQNDTYRRFQQDIPFSPEQFEEQVLSIATQQLQAVVQDAEIDFSEYLRDMLKWAFPSFEGEINFRPPVPVQHYLEQAAQFLDEWDARRHAPEFYALFQRALRNERDPARDALIQGLAPGGQLAAEVREHLTSSSERLVQARGTGDADIMHDQIIQELAWLFDQFAEVIQSAAPTPVRVPAPVIATTATMVAAGRDILAATIDADDSRQGATVLSNDAKTFGAAARDDRDITIFFALTAARLGNVENWDVPEPAQAAEGGLFSFFRKSSPPRERVPQRVADRTFHFDREIADLRDILYGREQFQKVPQQLRRDLIVGWAQQVTPTDHPRAALINDLKKRVMELEQRWQKRDPRLAHDYLQYRRRQIELQKQAAARPAQ